VRDSVFIAVHHYQDENIVARGDLVADSYRLAVEAARSPAKYVVVCGVRFMAESVATLARPDQIVLHPEPDAGCPMADMIDADTAARTLALLREFEQDSEIVPVTYMNSSNAVKALTGREGGAICTSGNARPILAHFFSRRKRVFFLPDANLGLNTARAMGIPEGATARISRDGALPGGLVPGAAKLFAWDGYCPVHKVMTAGDVSLFRGAHPGAKVIVHPECVPEVASVSDGTGSTEGLLKTLAAAPAGSVWGVGTEIQFVERMKATFPDRAIYPIRASSCANMAKVTEANLEKALEAIRAYEASDAARQPPNAARLAETALGNFAVAVRDDERADAARALEAMVRITEGAK